MIKEIVKRLRKMKDLRDDNDALGSFAQQVISDSDISRMRMIVMVMRMILVVIKIVTGCCTTNHHDDDNCGNI